MAKVIVQPGHDPRAIADLAGSARHGQMGFRQEDLELEVVDVTQAALDAALVDYTANQAARDAAFQVTVDAETVGSKQQEFNDDDVLRAAVDALREEINILRALHALPDISKGAMEGSVRNKIANP